jgi:hypothetical protein
MSGTLSTLLGSSLILIAIVGPLAINWRAYLSKFAPPLFR